MRMHRGSSKDVAGPPPAAESLPLSASSPLEIEVDVEVVRARTVERHHFRLAPGTTVRAVLETIRAPPEGSAVLVNEVPVPLDLPIDRPVRLTVVPTFSGG